jgi:hypothetical protein
MPPEFGEMHFLTCVDMTYVCGSVHEHMPCISYTLCTKTLYRHLWDRDEAKQQEAGSMDVDISRKRSPAICALTSDC